MLTIPSSQAASKAATDPENSAIASNGSVAAKWMQNTRTVSVFHAFHQRFIP